MPVKLVQYTVWIELVFYPIIIKKYLIQWMKWRYRIVPRTSGGKNGSNQIGVSQCLTRTSSPSLLLDVNFELVARTQQKIIRRCLRGKNGTFCYKFFRKKTKDFRRLFFMPHFYCCHRRRRCILWSLISAGTKSPFQPYLDLFFITIPHMLHITKYASSLLCFQMAHL